MCGKRGRLVIDIKGLLLLEWGDSLSVDWLLLNKDFMVLLWNKTGL